MVAFSKPIAAVAVLVSVVSAQSFQRLGTCPELGCIIPPDQADFLAGQRFDIRLEVHAPVNGSEATGNPNPDEKFSFTIEKVGGRGGAVPGTKWFKTSEPKLEKWTFKWFEDYFARDAKTPSVVNVASKAWRNVHLDEAGEYKVTLKYDGGKTTTAIWNVRDLSEVRKTKNVLFFIGDGMTTNMITAARLIGHKTRNGKYLTKMAMDTFPVLGHAMTHSVDTFITDSANSATALYTGHKTSVNGLGVYADSSPSVFDDPKIESIVELFHRVYKGHIGIVSTAAVADATPAALTAHTRDRGEYPYCVDSLLRGTPNYTWTEWNGPDVLFGGGAKQFFPPSMGGETYLGRDYYKEFSKAGYDIYLNKTSLAKAPNNKRALGIFHTSHLHTWLDRNVYKDNLKDQKNHPSGNKGDAEDQPGLKEMTLKAIDILHERSKNDSKGHKGWFLMSEAASIDKQMHALDYDRALGDLLELDDTIRASIEKLKRLGEFKDTLIVVTADHGHGFDVMGSVDTKYLSSQKEDRKKRGAVGVYEQSGQSQYINSGNLKYSEGEHFPTNWTPRYSLFAGAAASPDRRENYKLHEDGSREGTSSTPGRDKKDYYVNAKDAPDGFIVNGTLPVTESQGVHSLTDVPVFAMGPCQELFGGVQNNIDIFFNMANCMGLSRYGKGKGRDEPPKYGHY